MRILILFLALSKLIFAQYDSTMYDLIKTTYERSFDKQIISKYLNSDIAYKTRAAILSIAQSEDTSFVPELLKLDVTKFGSQVCFALAQNGECDQSISFLWNYLHSSPPPNHFPKIFFAIGKIGYENDLKKLVEFYNSFDGPIFPFEGISEAILQFQIRGIKSGDAKSILENEITHQLSNKTRIEKALFTLARYQNNDLTSDQFKILFESNYAKKDVVFTQFVLMNVNKKICLRSVELEKIISSNSPLTKIQLAKILHFIEIDSTTSPKNIIDYYLRLLNDDNQNVVQQSAISIINIKSFLNDSLKTLVKNKVDSLLFDSTKSLSFKGKLFLSRFELFGNYDEHMDLIGLGVSIDTDQFLAFNIRSFGSYPPQKQLIEYFLVSPSITSSIKIFEEFINSKTKIKDSLDYKKIIFAALKSNPPKISLAADNIDSIFIFNYQNELKELIFDKISNLGDNLNFLEATMALVNLAEMIDKEFYSQIIEKTKSSELFSIRKFYSIKTGDKQIGFKELDKLEDIWDFAFKYKQAVIRTSKGEVVIEFDSEIAPISVANFCMLTKQNFYNGIMFHRVVPGFVIQAGDPTATGWGGPGYDIISEFSDTDFDIGYVGMASAGKDTESSQFFIMQGNYPHLDSKYTLFAKVIEGMDVVYKITEEDKILNIELR
ncbi:MAG: peptidylprolyl isomerase [Ignavibacteriaceae bacterium]